MSKPKEIYVAENPAGSIAVIPPIDVMYCSYDKRYQRRSTNTYIEKSAYDKVVSELKFNCKYYKSCGDESDPEFQLYQSSMKLLKELGEIDD